MNRIAAIAALARSEHRTIDALAVIVRHRLNPVGYTENATTMADFLATHPVGDNELAFVLHDLAAYGVAQVTHSGQEIEILVEGRQPPATLPQLRDALKNMLDAYWAEGDGEPPAFVKEAIDLIGWQHRPIHTRAMRNEAERETGRKVGAERGKLPVAEAAAQAGLTFNPETRTITMPERDDTQPHATRAFDPQDPFKIKERRPGQPISIKLDPLSARAEVMAARMALARFKRAAGELEQAWDGTALDMGNYQGDPKQAGGLPSFGELNMIIQGWEFEYFGQERTAEERAADNAEIERRLATPEAARLRKALELIAQRTVGTKQLSGSVWSLADRALRGEDVTAE